MVVRDVDNGEAQPLLEVADLVAHLPAQPRIEVRQRLVEEQHRRLEHERAGYRHALLLAAGELGGQPLAESGQADRLERHAGSRFDFDAREPRDGEPVPDVFPHAHVREQRVALEHHRYVARGGGNVGDVDTADRDGTHRRLLEARDDAQDRRLAASGRPEQRDQRAGRDGERNIVDRDDVPVALADMAKLDRRRVHPHDGAPGASTGSTVGIGAALGGPARRPSRRSPTTH